MMVWMLAMAALAALAADHPCDPAYPDACVDPSVVVAPGSEVQRGASVGPNVILGNVVVGARAVLHGRDQGPTSQPVGDGTVIGRRTTVGADASVGEDVELGSAVTIGTGLDAGDMSMVGYGSQLGDNVTLGASAALGSLVTVGSNVTIDGVVARGVLVGDGAQVSGVVGPQSEVGADAVIDGRVRKDAVIGEAAIVHAGARVGRGATLEYGVELQAGASVASGAVVPLCGRLGSTDRLRRGETWTGGTVSGCVEPGSADPFPMHTNATGRVNVVDITTNPATGDVFVAGSFQQEAWFGDTLITPMNPTISADGFVASYTGDGALRWVRHIVSNEGSSANEVVFFNGGVYVSGQFGGEVTLDSSTFINASGVSDLLVARLNPSTGAVVWSRQIQTNATSNISIIRDMDVSASGVHIVGAFTDSMDLLGPGASVLSTGSSNGRSAGFFLRLDLSGTWQLARHIGGAGQDLLNAVAVLPNGNIAMAGQLASTSLYGGAQALTTGLASTDARDGVLVISTPTGTVVAKRTVPGPSLNSIRALVATDSRIYAVLEYSQSLSFGSTNLSGGHGNEQAIGWFDLNGVPNRAYNPAPARTIRMLELARNGSGVVFAGYNQNGGTFSIAGTPIAGKVAMAVALSSTGTWEWAAVSQGGFFPFGRTIAPHTFGGHSGFVFGGYSRGVLEFGPNRFGAGNQDRYEGFWVPLSGAGVWDAVSF